MKHRSLLFSQARLYVSRLVSIVATFSIQWLAARFLLPEQTGIYLLSFSWVWLGSLAVLFGANFSLNHFIPRLLMDQNDSERAAHLKSSLLISFFLYLLAWLLSAFFWNPLQAYLHYSPALFLVWLGLVGWQSLGSEILRSHGRVEMAMWFAGPISQFISLALAVALYFAGSLTLLHFIDTSMAGSALAGLLLIYFAGSLFPKSWTRAAVVWKSHWNYSFDYFTVTIFLYIFIQIDLWVVSLVSDPAQVAVYSIAQRVALLATVPVSILNGVLMPQFSTLLRSKNHKELQTQLRLTALVGGLPPLILLILLAAVPALTEKVFGPAYISSTPIAQVICLGYVFHYSMGSVGVLLLMAGERKAMINTLFFCFCLLILMQVLGFHYFGIMGVAWASAAGLTLQAFYFLRTVRKVLGFRTWESLPATIPSPSFAADSTETHLKKEKP